MKKIVKKFINIFGYEIKRLRRDNPKQYFDEKKINFMDIASPGRPVGKMDLFLEDLKARGLNCKAVLDVGANQANWSRMAKKIYSEASFFLIEPQVEMKEKLDDFCREYQDVKYFLLGAGASKEVRTFTVDNDLQGSTFLPKPDARLQSVGRQREIQITTIDDLIDSSNILLPELIKLDIQGFELEALKGANKTFGYTEAYILEVSLFPFNDVPGIPVIDEVINFMLQRGYVVYDFPGFLRRPFDGALGQCDICFVKKNGFLRSSNGW